MGQIFCAVAMDLKNNEASCLYADKLHANCYSFSEAVCNMHYLLRQKPMNVLWLGEYVMSAECLKNETSEIILKAIATETLGGWDICNKIAKQEKDVVAQWEKICGYAKQFKPINSYDDALKYFNWEKNHSPKYAGFLVKHTQKVAINLKDYYRSSVSMCENGELFCIDPIPILTATEENMLLVFGRWITTQTSIQLCETWCGDLLEIRHEVPVGMKMIKCCFPSLKERVLYCYHHYGVDENDMLKDENNTLLECINLINKSLINIKAVKEGDMLTCKSVPITE